MVFHCSSRSNSQFCLATILIALLLVPMTAAFATRASAAENVVVLVKPIQPFVNYDKDGALSGFSIDLWQALAKRAELKTTFRRVKTLSELLDGIKIGSADAAIAAITINSQRERDMDFSHSYFHSGLRVLVQNENTGLARKIWATVLSILTSRTFITAALIFVITLLVAAHIIWLFERRRNRQFSQRYLPGLWDAFWWSLVTVSTVGYGDKTPQTHRGRGFAIIWIIFGYLGFAWFTAIVTSTVTISQLSSAISGPDDLAGHRVGTVRASTSATWLARNAPGARVFRHANVNRAYEKLIAGDLDAVVYDNPSVLYFAAHDGAGKVRVAGPVFHQEEYGIAFPTGSTLRENINRALLDLMEDGTYARIHIKWFGHGPGG